MKKIIEIHSYDFDWGSGSFVKRGPRYINADSIVEIKPKPYGYTMVLYRSGKEVKDFYTDEPAADLVRRINE